MSYGWIPITRAPQSSLKFSAHLCLTIQARCNRQCTVRAVISIQTLLQWIRFRHARSNTKGFNLPSDLFHIVTSRVGLVSEVRDPRWRTGPRKSVHDAS